VITTTFLHIRVPSAQTYSIRPLRIVTEPRLAGRRIAYCLTAPLLICVADIGCYVPLSLFPHGVEALVGNSSEKYFCEMLWHFSRIEI
jgi:hypothetical protein